MTMTLTKAQRIRIVKAVFASNRAGKRVFPRKPSASDDAPQASTEAPETPTVNPPAPTLPDTSQATSLWELMDELPRATDWAALHHHLELLLALGTEAAPTLTLPERQLLAGLRSRAAFLASPLYQALEAESPTWWVAIMAGAGARVAQYPQG